MLKSEIKIYSTVILDYIYQNTNLMICSDPTFKTGYNKKVTLRLYRILKRYNPDDLINIIMDNMELQIIISTLMLQNKDIIDYNNRVYDESYLIINNDSYIYNQLVRCNNIYSFIATIHRNIQYINDKYNMNIKFYEVDYYNIYRSFKED